MIPVSTWPWLIGGAAVFGLLIGSFLNVVVWRVPRGESVMPGSRCPHCRAPIRVWQNIPVLSWLLLRAKCANCRGSISSRYPIVELVTAAAFGLVMWWCLASAPESALAAPAQVAWWLGVVAYLWFAAASIALTVIDLEHQRLPDAIVLPSLVAVAVLLSLAATVVADWARLVSTLGGAAVLFALYLVIALVYPKGIGGGDVKLAPVVGLVLGGVGWSAVAVGAFAGFLFAALFGLALMIAGRGTRKSNIAFGPWMLLGAWIGAVFGPQVMAGYLGLVGLA